MKKLNDFSDSKNMANIEACYFIKHKHLISEECTAASVHLKVEEAEGSNANL